MTMKILFSAFVTDYFTIKNLLNCQQQLGNCWNGLPWLKIKAHQI